MVKRFLLVFIVLCISHVSPVLYAGEPTMPKASYVTAVEAKEWIAERIDIVFVDVREPFEFEKGHIEGAANIPYAHIEKKIGEFQKNKTYVFYCTRSAWRAPYAANTLQDYGVKEAYVLSGGIAAWHAGKEVIISADPAEEPTVVSYPKDLPKAFRHPKDREYGGSLVLTIEELKSYDGLDGRPAFVAVNGVVYDMTNSRLWRGGEHAPSERQAWAGHDLTEVIKQSPHGDVHLKDFPVVGKLAD